MEFAVLIALPAVVISALVIAERRRSHRRQALGLRFPNVDPSAGLRLQQPVRRKTVQGR